MRISRCVVIPRPSLGSSSKKFLQRSVNARKKRFAFHELSIVVLRNLADLILLKPLVKIYSAALAQYRRMWDGFYSGHIGSL